MTKYEIIAFYKEDQREIVEVGEKISQLYHLRLRCEKIPRNEKSIAILLGDDCVLCLLQRKEYSFYRLMRYVYALNKPILILQDNFSFETYRCLKIPVGYLQENKEKVVWANFLQRHHPDCRIELIVPREKDENIMTMVHNNVDFMERILKYSEARYEVVREEKSFEKSLVKIFQAATPGIILMMRPFRIFSFYYPSTLRLYRKHSQNGILVIPRDEDLYIPCH